MKRFGLFLILMMLLGVGVMASVVEAQCAPPPAGWQTYTVARGDNLSAIARRYNTTAMVLAQVNCISNPSLIYAGTRLYVPPGGTSGGNGGNPIVVRAAYQPFENGFMLWNAATGSVNVFVGQNGGNVMLFPVWLYGLLPNDPYKGTPPASHLQRPILGFGKVWGFFSHVRSSIGWATGPETHYYMNITTPSSGYTRYSLPNGRTVQVASTYGWTYIESVPPTPVVTPTQPQPSVVRFWTDQNPLPYPTSSFNLNWDARNIAGVSSVDIEWQNAQFGLEHRANLPLNGTLTLNVKDVALTTRFASFRLYGLDSAGQRIQSITADLNLEIPPSPQMVVNSFTASPNPATYNGQVTLSWQVTAPHPVQVYISRLDYRGTILRGAPELASAFPATGSVTVTIPTEYTTAVYYILTAVDDRGSSMTTNTVQVNISTPAPVASISNFSADKTTAVPGEEVTLAWTATGGTMMLLEVIDLTASGETPVTYYYNLSHQSLYTMTMLPAGTQGMKYVLSVVETPTTPPPHNLDQFKKLASATVTVGREPLDASNSTYIAYQHFERGFMVWWSSDESIMVFYNDGTTRRYDIGSYASLPENPIPDESPAGLVKPVSGFGRVWGNFQEVRDHLGWGTSVEGGFTTPLTTSGYVNPGSTIFMLPDERIIAHRSGFWNLQ